MDWIARLNHTENRLSVAGGRVEILHWNYNHELPDNAWHRHAYFELCLVGGHGEGCFFVGETTYPLQPGTLFLARPGALHRIENTQTPGMELYWVSFAVATTGIGALQRFVESEVVVTSEAPAVTAAWQALRVVAEDLSSDEELVALIRALFGGIVRIAGGGIVSPADEPLRTGAARQAIRFIHDNLERRDLGVGEVATAAAVSPRHLARLLRAVTGVAPAAYIELARMERARLLLLRTDEPIKQIAQQIGYPDVHHFTRAFRRVFGCPPGQFRTTNGASSQRALIASVQIEGALV